MREESASASLGKGLKEEGVKREGAREELEWWRERVCGAKDKKWVEAAIAICFLNLATALR